MNPLKPVMAAVLAACACPALAQDQAASEPTATEVAGQSKSTIDRLADAIDAPEARSDAAAREAEFLFAKDGSGKGFATEDADKDAVGAAVKAWTTAAPKGDVAFLYFVLGPSGEAPGWVKADPALAKVMKPGMKWEGRLRQKLSKYADKAPIGKDQAAPAVAAFLQEAAKGAREVFYDQRTQSELLASVKLNDKTAPEVPGKPGVGKSALGSSQAYGFDELYLQGGVSGVIDVPKPNGPRQVSMKILTQPGAGGELEYMLAIYEVTDRNDSIVQTFPLKNGKQTFVLDDRNSKNLKYTLDIHTNDKGEQEIVFSRPDKEKDCIKTADNRIPTVEGLFLERANQAARLGNLVTVGDKQFYVVPQGGPQNGGLAFLEAELVKHRADVSPRTLRPSLYAETTTMGQLGEGADVGGKPALGSVDGKPYHLEKGPKGIWQVAEGEGDKPKKKEEKKDAKPGDAKDPGAKGSGGVSAAGDAGTLAEVEKQARTAGFEEKTEDEAEFDDDVKSRTKILYRMDNTEGPVYLVVVPLSVRPRGQVSYKNTHTVDNSVQLMIQRVRGVKHFVVAEYDKNFYYYDLNKPAANPEGGFDQVGVVAGGKDEKSPRSLQNYADVDAFIDAASHYLGVKGDALTKIPERAKQVAAGSTEFKLSATTDKGAFIAFILTKGITTELWPDFKAGKQGESQANWAQLKGPGAAFDGADEVKSSGDEAFPDPGFELPASQEAVKLVQKFEDVASYETVSVAGQDAKPEDKKFYVMYRFRAKDKDGKTVVRRTNAMELFGKDRPLPSGYAIGGLLGADVPVVEDALTMGANFVTGTTKDKGVIAVYQLKQGAGSQNLKSKEGNCVGPIAWWGVADRDAAMKACKDDKLP